MRTNWLSLLGIACVVLGSASVESVLAQRKKAASKPRAAQPRAARTSAATQQPVAPPMPVLPDIRNDPDVEAADIAIIANITAKELRFDVVPNPTVEFTDKSKAQSIWHADRYNLPDRIEPGVTYRNIGIRLKIVSRLADIERIVAEALGEIPSDQKPPPPRAVSGVEPTVPASPAPTPSVRRQPK